MSMLHELEQAFPEDSDNSDAVILADLKARVKELERRKGVKSQARAALTSLRKRYEKREKLPSHPCGDLLPYRYSSSIKINLGRDVVPIITFVCLARYLTKSQVENLAAHKPALEEAKLLLQNEDFHSHWFDCYINWRKSNRQLAFDFFLEVTDAIKAEEAKHLETSLANAIGVSNKTATEVATGVYPPGRKRQRSESCNPSQDILSPSQSTRNDQHTQGALASTAPCIEASQVWNAHANTSLPNGCGEQQLAGSVSSIRQQTPQLDIYNSPILYLPYSFPFKYTGLTTAQLDYVVGSQSFLSAGMRTSRRWRDGDRTICFGLAIPDNVNEDAMIMIAASQWFVDSLIEHLVPM